MSESPNREKRPGRGRETLFRVTIRHQVDLIQIADNKANMIITINALVISAIFTVIGSSLINGHLSGFGIWLLIPISMVLLSCLSSLVMAILAARPKIIRLSGRAGSGERTSLFFFEEIARHSQAEYVDRIKSMLARDFDIYENLIIDIHNQGRILRRKYHLLSWAYQILMFGFIFSVLVFLAFMLGRLL